MNEELLRELPGATLLRSGRADFLGGRRTVSALLVAIAHGRLSRAGFLPPDAPAPSASPELELYEMLRREGGDAYSRYNALLRELTSFETALERRVQVGSR